MMRFGQASEPSDGAPRKAAKAWWRGLLRADFLAPILIAAALCLALVQHPDYGRYALALWLAIAVFLIAMKPARFLRALRRRWIWLLLPLWACASYLWSLAPGLSIRYGLQFLFTVAAAALFAEWLSARRMAGALAWALAIYLLASIANGRQGLSAEGPVLIGLAGAKNQLGNVAAFALMTAAAFLLARASSLAVRAAALALIALSLALLARISATGAALTAFAGAGAIFAMALFAQLGALEARVRGLKAGVLAFFVVVLGAVAVAAPEIDRGVTRFMEEALHKDATLTGRTELWAVADELIARKPIFGRGYQAFWLTDDPEALYLLRRAGGPDPRGFHFHHTFRQMSVDLGLVGGALYLGPFVLALLIGLVRVLRDPTPMRALFTVLLALIVGLSFFELVITPFAGQSLILYLAAFYASSPLARRAADAVPQPGPLSPA